MGSVSDAAMGVGSMVASGLCGYIAAKSAKWNVRKVVPFAMAVAGTAMCLTPTGIGLKAAVVGVSILGGALSGALITHEQSPANLKKRSFCNGVAFGAAIGGLLGLEFGALGAFWSGGLASYAIASATI